MSDAAATTGTGSTSNAGAAGTDGSKAGSAGASAGATGAGASGETGKANGTGGAADAAGSKAAEGGGEKAKSATSILGDLSDADKGKEGEQGAKGDGSKDKSADAGELEIKVPEGVTFDPAELASFKAFAKEAKLTSEQASAVAAYDAQRQARADKAWQEQGEKWAKELQADKDFGGEKLAQTVLDAKRPLLKAGPQGKALSDLLAKTGQGNHPVIVRALAVIGRMFKEDSTGGAKANGATGGPLSQEERWGRALYNKSQAGA